MLDPLPTAVAGLRVQVHESLAPQLLLENPGVEPIEVLDELGAPFLRIGPAGVEANLASPSWYLTASPSDAVPIPNDVARAGAEGKSLAPRWRIVAREPAWGWFDRRIEVQQLSVPHEIVTAGRPAELGRWEVPLQRGGERHALGGRFVYQPNRGSLRVRLESAHELAPGVRVSLLSGRGGSFFLRSDSPEPVTVFGRDGEPFLRFSPAGVEANTRSATFAEVDRLRGGTGPAASGPEAEGAATWRLISPSARYGWVDPRTLFEVPDPVRSGSERALLGRWTLPVSVGRGDDAVPAKIEGATWWEPLPVRPPDVGRAKKE